MSGEEKEELERRLGRPISERDWWNYLYSHDVPGGVDAILEAAAHFRRKYGLSKREEASACAEDQAGPKQPTVPPGEQEYILGGSSLDDLEVLARQLEERAIMGNMIPGSGVSDYMEIDPGVRIRLFSVPLSCAEEEGKAEMSEVGVAISVGEDTSIEDIRAAWPRIKSVRQRIIQNLGLSIMQKYHGLHSLLHLLHTQGAVEFYEDGGKWWIRRPHWSLDRLATALNGRITENLSNFVLGRCAAHGGTWEVRAGRVIRDWPPFDTLGAAYAAANEGLFLGVEVLSSYSAMDLLVGMGFSKTDAREQIQRGVENLRQGGEAFPEGEPVDRHRVRNRIRQWRCKLEQYGLDREEEAEEAAPAGEAPTVATTAEEGLPTWLAEGPAPAEEDGGRAV